MEAVLGHVDSSYINSGYLLRVYLYIYLRVCACACVFANANTSKWYSNMNVFNTKHTVGY